MARATYIPITPSVLRWAIDESGFSDPEFAAKIKVERDALAGFLAGQVQPTKTQFRAIVDAVRRPSAVFFLPEAPSEATLRPPFRRAIGDSTRRLRPKELREVRWALRLQRLVARIRESDGAVPVVFPKTRHDANPEAAADAIRRALNVSLDAQQSWTTASAAFRGWRAAAEALGIVVLQLRLDREDVRGFASWHPHAPLAAVSTAFIPQARSFSLCHELAHLVLRHDAATDISSGREPAARVAAVERWCERTAAAVLLPASEVRTVVDPTDGTGDFERARQLAVRFKVSLRAATVRLVELKLAPKGLYAVVSEGAPVADYPERRKGGGGQSAAEMRLGQLGRPTARRIVDAVRSERLSERDAREHLRLGGIGFRDLASLAASEASG